MATGLINVTINVIGNYSNVLHIKAYPASNPTVSDAEEDVNPPYANPISVSLVTPSKEAHYIQITDVNNNVVAYNVVNYNNTTGVGTVNPIIYGFKCGTGNSYPGTTTFTLNQEPYDFRGKKIINFGKGGNILVENFNYTFDPATGKFNLLNDQWALNEIGFIVGL